MENAPQTPYSDSPSDTQSTSPPSSASSVTIKPLPALPTPAAPRTGQGPYRDEPPTPTEIYHAQHRTSSLSVHLPQYQLHYQPYTDLPSPSEAPSPTSDEDVPLAHLVLYPQTPTHAQTQPYLIEPSYPLEAPPSYSVAVRQSYRDTLIQYIPGSQHNPQEPLLVEIDEESGVDMASADEVRHSVEKVVAMFVVASLLLVIAAVFGWLALGSGVWS